MSDYAVRIHTRDIIEDLQRALEQLKLIAEDVGEAEDTVVEP